MKKIESILNKIAYEFPADMVSGQLQDVTRIAFHIRLVLKRTKMNPDNLTIMDIGGGIGLFSVCCAALGFKRIVLVDDFQDPVNRQVGDSVLALHRKYGVEVMSRDAIKLETNDVSGFDVITSFDSMEHWHHSPRKLFQKIVAGLNPGGALILGVPNCVNLRKRIAVPFGICKWSSMQDWYEEEIFRGHVREADVDDLQYIARDLKLTNISIYGRNWLGIYSRSTFIKTMTHIFDYPLRFMPSLCSDIYLVGTKSPLY